MTKWLLLIFLLTVGFLGLLSVSGKAQEESTATPITPPVTALQRPTILSTGLPTPMQAIPVRTASPTRRISATPSPTRTATLTRTPTLTPSETLTPSVSPSASLTLTSIPSLTFTPSWTFTASATATASFTHTSAPSATVNAANTVIASSTPSHTFTSSATATATYTYTASSTNTPSATATTTFTATASSTATATFTPTVTPSATNTAVPINVTSSPAATREDDGLGLPVVLLVLLAAVGLGAYVILYALNSAALDRYSTGFVIHHCPVCGEGYLEIEERFYRSAGIPRARRTVRCDNCRSVLREVGRKRWRYAVDPNANPALYDELNSRIMSEAELVTLKPDAADEKPLYMEE